jgi:hypothetical protein
MLDTAIFHLAQNPEMQEKAYDEIQVRKIIQSSFCSSNPTESGRIHLQRIEYDKKK